MCDIATTLDGIADKIKKPLVIEEEEEDE